MKAENERERVLVGFVDVNRSKIKGKWFYKGEEESKTAVRKPF